MKHFRLLPDQIRPIAPGIGGCFASDMIPVDGEPVRYMYREPARGDWDSGWRFFSGVESQEYVDNADNVAIYDVNTIANYDPSIVQFLDEPVGTAFEKSANGEFCRVPFPIDPDAN
ncbi:MAG: DUF2185 domain-containing protein [Polyangiaceae bacterium]|nr:DUF2185 domain-containing protein [Polyangiaceae bacterium]